MVSRFNAKLAYGLGGIFRERMEKCEKCRSIDFTVVPHPVNDGLMVLECAMCRTIYVTVNRNPKE